MKIIGIASSSHDPTYVATVTHSEIEKVLGLYYNKSPSHFKPGDTVDFSNGYDFRNDIRATLSSMTDSMTKFDRARATLMAFAAMVSNLPPELQTPATGKDGEA